MRLPSYSIVVLLVALSVLAGCGRPNSAAPAKAPVVVIGFDGLTFDKLLPWVAEGKLPNFARFIEAGTRGPLQSVLPISSPPAWTTASTGVNPGQHGIYGFLGPLRVAGRLTFNTARDRKVVPVWTLVGREGRRVVVINVPCTSPPDAVNGVMVAGFPHLKSDPLSVPPGLLARFPDYRIDVFADSPVLGQEDAWLAQLMDVERARENLTLTMLKEQRPDLLWVVFTAPDRAQHFLWKYSDPTHPAYTAEGERRHGDGILRVYQLMDEFLGQLTAAAGPEATVIVLSDHGFGPALKGIRVGEVLARVLPGIDETSVPSAYIPDYFGAGIHLNQAGREPGGVVAPRAYESTRAALRERLLALRDPDDGLPLFSSIETKEAIYRGSTLDLAPDLVAREREGLLVTRFDGAGLTGPLPATFFSGFHRRAGVFLAGGPRIRRGANIDGARLEDVAPTVLALLDLPVPDQMEGRVLVDLLEAPQSLAVRHVRLPESEWLEAPRPSSEPQTEVREQLRSLGYIN